MRRECTRTGTATAVPVRRHLLALLGSALDMVDLLLDEVLEPVAGHRDSPGNCAADADLTKEVAEVAMLLRLTVRAGDHALAVRARRTGRRLAPLARGPRTRLELVRRPSGAAPHLLAHACLTDLGLPDDGFDRLARLALTGSASAAAERVPYRLLDVAWIRHLLLGDAELASPALALSPLGVGVDLLGVTTEAAYAFSHALPYATDFGRLPLPQTVDRAALAQTADLLVATALADDDLDLLAELVATAALLDTPWTVVQRFALAVILDVWDERGYLPGPGLPAAPAGEPRAAAVRRVLGTMYHTTLVGGLLCATLLSTGRLPGPAPTPAGDCACTAADPAGSDRCWTRVWHRLDDGDRARLRHVPRVVGTATALRSCDLTGLASAVGTERSRCGLPAVAVVQACEALERAAALLC